MTATRIFLTFLAIFSVLLGLGKLLPQYLNPEMLPGYEEAQKDQVPFPRPSNSDSSQQGSELADRQNRSLESEKKIDARNQKEFSPDQGKNDQNKHTLSWKEELISALHQTWSLESSSSVTKKDYVSLKVKQGRPIHEYALELQELCEQMHLKIRDAVEHSDRYYWLEFRITKRSDSLNLHLSYSPEFLKASAKIALIFDGIDSASATELAALEDLSWAKTMVINPYAKNEILPKLRYTAGRNQLLLRQALEPAQYPYLNPGPEALMIHFTQEQVDRQLAKTLDLYPNATGFASHMGSRAVENRPLLEKMFHFTKSRDLLFLDRTQSPRSLAEEIGRELEARVWIADGNPIKKDFTGQLIVGLIAAQKMGSSALFINYNERIFQELKSFKEEKSSWLESQGLDFVTLEELIKN